MTGGGSRGWGVVSIGQVRASHRRRARCRCLCRKKLQEEEGEAAAGTGGRRVPEQEKKCVKEK